MIASALITQARVIHALILREVKTRFGRQQLGYLWAFIEPCVYVAVFTALMSYRQRVAPIGMPLVLFMITGVVPFFLFRETLSKCLRAIESNTSLLYFPQVTIFDFVLARAVLEISTLAVVFAAIVGVAAALGQPVQIEDPLRVIIWFFVLGLMAFGLGAGFAALVPLVPSVERLVPSVLIRPLLFISGVFFSADMIPEAIRPILLINPIMHVLELIRSGFFLQFETAHGSPRYVIMCTIGALFFGFLLQRALRVRILKAVEV